jgi:two-component system, NtrC family, nitrogen regulation response regulator NtrX
MAQPESASRILLVEDEPVLARIYSRALTAAGYEVDIAGDGAEGLELLLERPYDVVVTDVCMPRRSGLDLLEDAGRLRPQVAFVLMTAHLDANVYSQALDMGTVRYLMKPFTVEQLARAVESAVLVRAARHRLSERRTVVSRRR